MIILFEQLQSLLGKAVVELLATYVENLYLWRLGGVVGALLECQQAVAAALRFVPTLQAGRGAAEQYRATALLTAPNRQIARLIAQFVVLFERAVVFFVHHNQRQIGQRGEHRQPRADNQLGLPHHRPQIILCAAAGSGLTVQHGGRHLAETLRHPLQ